MLYTILIIQVDESWILHIPTVVVAVVDVFDASVFSKQNYSQINKIDALE